MKVTLVMLLFAALTIYCKCVAVLSLPRSLIAHAASLDENLKAQKPFTASDNESQQQLLTKENEEGSYTPALAAGLYKNFKNFWHNDLSLNLRKREQRNTFDDDIDDAASVQQVVATMQKNNQNECGLQSYSDDNAGHNNCNHNNNKNKNENNILKSSLTSSWPLSRSSAATNVNEVTNFNLNTLTGLQAPSQNMDKTEVYDSTNDFLYSSPQMIDDIFVAPSHQLEAPLNLKRRELDEMPLAAATAYTEGSPFLNGVLKFAKYASRQCPLENENNCLQEYYGALIADRNKALLEKLNSFTEADKSPPFQHNNGVDDDDIVLLLTAEQNLKQFLSWALSELYPYGKFANVLENGADYYHPGVYIWKKFNLSGRVEPPLLVDEPHYVIVRREYDGYGDDNGYKGDLNYGGNPFIPPRGRKHNLPDLDSLLQRYETFVPNRGRRDKIKDIFKYDDLFYPNRGKRQMAAATNENDDGDIEHIKETQHYTSNERNADRPEIQHPLLSNELVEYIEKLAAKMERKLHQQPKQRRDKKTAKIFDEIFHRNDPTAKMSTTFQQSPPATSSSSAIMEKRLKPTINILQNKKKLQQQHLPNQYNGRREKWWKRYTAAETSSTQTAHNNDRVVPAIRSPTRATNRLQTTLKSMSPRQQLMQQPYEIPDLSPPHSKLANKFMRQQEKSLAQQFDPLSWHKLQLLLQQHHQQPALTWRNRRLVALPHLPTMQQPLQLQPQHQHRHQQQQAIQLPLAMPQERQLTYSYHQHDNNITNDLDNLYNKDLD